MLLIRRDAHDDHRATWFDHRRSQLIRIRFPGHLKGYIHAGAVRHIHDSGYGILCMRINGLVSSQFTGDLTPVGQWLQNAYFARAAHCRRCLHQKQPLRSRSRNSYGLAGKGIYYIFSIGDGIYAYAHRLHYGTPLRWHVLWNKVYISLRNFVKLLVSAIHRRQAHKLEVPANVGHASPAHIANAAPQAGVNRDLRAHDAFIFHITTHIRHYSAQFVSLDHPRSSRNTWHTMIPVFHLSRADTGNCRFYQHFTWSRDWNLSVLNSHIPWPIEHGSPIFVRHLFPPG